jgi:CRP-like cAMP-binding protein
VSELPEALRTCELLRGLSSVEAQDVLALASRVELPAGEELFHEGDDGDAMYVVASGEIRVVKGEEEVARLGAGEVLGEMALLEDAPRSATARAASTCTVYRIDRGAFEELLESEDHAAYRLLHGLARLLCARLRRAIGGSARPGA